MPARKSNAPKPEENKSLEQWIWDAGAVSCGSGSAGDNNDTTDRQWFVGLDILIGWLEEEKLSRIVDHAELKKNDYNISPSRYIHTSDAETYRPIAEIVAELDAIEAEARETDKALRKILKQLGV